MLSREIRDGRAHCSLMDAQSLPRDRQRFQHSQCIRTCIVQTVFSPSVYAFTMYKTVLLVSLRLFLLLMVLMMMYKNKKLVDE